MSTPCRKHGQKNCPLCDNGFDKTEGNGFDSFAESVVDAVEGASKKTIKKFRSGAKSIAGAAKKAAAKIAAGAKKTVAKKSGAKKSAAKKATPKKGRRR
jgi:tRNA U54 and U55 pseudouridine synthase Pus10